MELREYGRILLRRWWIPVLLAGLVAILSAWQLRPWQAPPPAYAVSLRLLLGVLPLAEADITDYDPRYYAWLTSEYLVDDFTEVVRSGLFAEGVNRRLAGRGIEIPAGLIRGSATTGRQHRIIQLTLQGGEPEQLAAIAEAAAAELVENAGAYFHQLGTDQAVVTLLDQPAVVPLAPDLRRRLEFPVRVLLAFLVGVGIVFVLDYLDTSVRRTQDLEEMGLPVLAAIPKKWNRR